MYVYQECEPGLFTVGFYDPSGKWHPESDHGDMTEATSRVALLNGSPANATQSPEDTQTRALIDLTVSSKIRRGSK